MFFFKFITVINILLIELQKMQELLCPFNFQVLTHNVHINNIGRKTKISAKYI